MRDAQLTIRVKPPGETWTVIGTHHANGIWATGVQLAANTAGSDTASFALGRDPDLPWPDLSAFTPVDIEVGGVIVWSGRISEAPLTDGDRVATNVVCQGWQYHLDDDLLDVGYAAWGTARWRDQRSFLTYSPAAVRQNGTVTAGQNGASYGWGAGSTVITGEGQGVTFDAGPTRRIVRALVAFDLPNARPGDILSYLRGNDTENVHDGSTDDTSALWSTFGATGNIQRRTFSTPRRYVNHFCWYTGPGGTFGADVSCRITGVFLVTDTAYESGDASILKASQVAAHVLASGALPLLSTDTSRITTTATNIPDFWPDGYQTPRQLLQSVNAFHDYLLGVDVNRRLYFQARPTVPAVEIGQWSGAELSDASAGAGDPLVNEVVVQYTGPAGESAVVVSTDTSATNLVTRQGFTRSKTLPLALPTTSTIAQVIGDTYLAARKLPDFKGSCTVTAPGGARTVNNGVPIHPSLLLLQPGQLMRLTNRVDPGTGQMGRDAVIASVSYNHDTGAAVVQLDNERDKLAPLLARYGLAIAGLS